MALRDISGHTLSRGPFRSAMVRSASISSFSSSLSIHVSGSSVSSTMGILSGSGYSALRSISSRGIGPEGRPNRNIRSMLSKRVLPVGWTLVA